MKTIMLFGLVAFGVLSAVESKRGALNVPFTFTNGTVANATEVNANFTAVETAVNDNDTRISTLEGLAGAPGRSLKPRFLQGSFGGSPARTTIVNATGPGVLQFISYKLGATAAGQASLWISIDGDTPQEFDTWLGASLIVNSSVPRARLEFAEGFHFATSLLIEVETTTGRFINELNIIYGIE